MSSFRRPRPTEAGRTRRTSGAAACCVRGGATAATTGGRVSVLLEGVDERLGVAGRLLHLLTELEAPVAVAHLDAVDVERADGEGRPLLQRLPRQQVDLGVGDGPADLQLVGQLERVEAGVG